MRSEYRLVTGLFVSLLVAAHCLAQKPKEVDSGERFTVDGLFSVGIPEKGYTWAEVKRIDDGKSKGQIYSCTKEGSSSTILLIVDERTIDGDTARTLALNSQVIGLIQGLMSEGATKLKPDKLPFEPPVADIVSYTVSAQTPDGRPLYVKGISRFGRNVFVLQAMAETKSEADALAKIADTVEEFPASKNARSASKKDK